MDPISVAKLLDGIEKLVAVQTENLEIQKKLLWEASTNRKSQDIMRLVQSTPVLDDVQAFAASVQLPFLETLRVIKEEELSFSRFGDGELKLMLRPDYKLKFQENSPAVAEALRETLLKPSEKLLMGLPHVFRDLHWTNVWVDIWGQFKPLVSEMSRVGNAHVSRPLFFQYTGQAGVDAWRGIWDQRSVAVITGKDSRFELSRALFDNCRSVSFIDSKPANAMGDVDRLVDVASKDPADIFLISLGPAGTVLSNKLAAAGRRAIDIGHISDSYENVFSGGAWPESKAVSR